MYFSKMCTFNGRIYFCALADVRPVEGTAPRLVGSGLSVGFAETAGIARTPEIQTFRF